MSVYVDITTRNPKNGEDLFFSIKSEASLVIRLLVYSLTRKKYIYYNFSDEVWEEDDNIQTTTYSSSGYYTTLGSVKFLNIRIPHRFFAKPDIVYILAEDINDTSKSDDVTVLYGEAFTLRARQINVYGQVFGIFGEPLPEEMIVFQVLNETTSYDSPVNSLMSVSTYSDENGRFSINLNRSYDYIITVPRLRFSKVLRLKNIPNSTSSVSVCLGEQGC